MLQKDGRKYAVISDEGFRVDRTGSPLTQFVLRYVEGDHVVEYPLENLAPGATTLIAPDAIEGWRPPFAGELIAPPKKQQIAERLVMALRFLGDRADLG